MIEEEPVKNVSPKGKEQIESKEEPEAKVELENEDDDGWEK